MNGYINTNADSLDAGGYQDTVTFTNTTNHSGDATRSVSLTVNAPPGVLIVSPSDGLTSSGYMGGPFSPPGKDYALTNTGGSPINWQASKSMQWVTLSKTSGNLGPGEDATVTVSINSNANSLSAGACSEHVVFNNMTNAQGNTSRAVTLTVSAASSEKKIGLLTVKADSITSAGSNKYTCSGNVVINNILKSTGTVTVNYDNITISGNGKLYLDGIPYVGEVPLYQGAYTINAAKALTSSINSALSLLKVGGVDVTISSIGIGSGKLIVKGKLNIKGPWGTAAIDVASDSNYISVGTSGGVQVVGQVRVQNLTIPGSGFVLKNGILIFNTPTASFSGQFDIGFPTGMVVLGNVLVSNGSLTSVGLGRDFSGQPPLNQPLLLQTPPIYLQRIYGRLEWASDWSRIIFSTTTLDGSSGDLALTAGPTWTIDGKQYYSVKGTLGVTIDSAGYLEGRGAIYVICDNYRMASAVLKIDKYKGLYIEGNLKFIDVLDVDGKLKVDLHNLFQGNLMGKLSCPEGWWFIGGMEFGAVRVYAENDFIIAAAPLPILGEVGVEFDRYGHVTVPADLTKIKEVVFSIRPGMLPSIVPETYDVPGGIAAAVFRLSWTSGNTDFTLIDPDGVGYAPTLATPTADAWYRKNLAVPEAFYAVASPKAGTWSIDVSNPSGIGAYGIELYVRPPSPAIEITSPATDTTSTGRVNIAWTDAASTDTAKIALYYDDDDSGLDGTLIASRLDALSSINSYSWNTTTVPSGQYYVYAKIEDGTNIPEFSYSTGAVTVVNRAAPGAPQNLVALAGDASISLSWDENPENDLLGYRLYYTSNLASPSYDHQVAAGADASCDLNGLSNGVMYRLCVTAIDTDLNESPASAVVYARPAVPANNNPVMTSVPERYGRAGVPYVYDASGSDIDGDILAFSLTSGPAGASMNAAGHLTWNPTTSQLGNNRFTITASDGKGGTAAQSFKVTVAGADEGNLGPSFVKCPPLEVRIGEVCTWTMGAVDPDGDAVTCRMATGPDGMEFDPPTASVFWIPRGYQEGVQNVLFEATDSHGARNRQRFAIRVRPEAVEAESNFVARRLLVRRNLKTANADRLMLRASFNTLGTTVNWAADALTVEVGPYSETLAGGSFTTKDNVKYTYKAPKGVTGIVRAQVDTKKHTLDVSAVGIDLSALGENVFVKVSIGGYEGSCYVDLQPRNSYNYGGAGLLLSNVFMVDKAQFTLNTRQANADSFTILGSLYSAARVDLVSEEVTIKVRGLEWTLAPGSFNRVGKKPVYTYRGGKADELASVQIDLQKGLLRITGKNIDLSGLSDTVEISISGGTFSGRTTIQLQQKGKGYWY